MAENTKDQSKRGDDQDQNSQKGKNRKQNTSTQGNQEGRQGSGRSFNSPDSGDESLTGREKGNRTGGSSITPKRNVTGSDYDGQAVE